MLLFIVYSRFILLPISLVTVSLINYDVCPCRRMMLYVHAGAWKRLLVGGLPKSCLSLVLSICECLSVDLCSEYIEFEPDGVSIDCCSFTSLC